jgi:hypothetical protein
MEEPMKRVILSFVLALGLAALASAQTGKSLQYSNSPTDTDYRMTIIEPTAGATIAGKDFNIVLDLPHVPPEIYTTANAASDPNGNEANTTTGWRAGYGIPTFASVGTENGIEPNTGAFQFHVGGAYNGDRSDYAFSVVARKRYIVTLNSKRYQGQFYHLLYVATTNSGDNFGTAINGTIALLASSYTTFSYSFVAPQTGTVYLSLRMEANSSPPVITYVDNISITELISGGRRGK